MPGSSSSHRPLLDFFPRGRATLPLARLGDYPTPVQDISSVLTRPGAPLYAKRDDLSSPVYGGNKVRTLEVLFGEALARGATRIYSTGAYGTNHGLATVMHAPRVGLEPGVILFPQPKTDCALVNLRAILGQRPIVRDLPHWSALPFGMIATARQEAREGRQAVIMVPGGATDVGGLGYVNAALELAEQVARGELPLPAEVVVGVGSNCTSAGLLVGFTLAARRGVGLAKAPLVRAMRVTPWPVTSKTRILWLAVEIARRLAQLAGDETLAFDVRTLARGLVVDGSQLGWGYGEPTKAGIRVLGAFRETLGWDLDTTYSAKAVAGAIAATRKASGPVVYWSTKSTAPLPELAPLDLHDAPPRMRRFMLETDRRLRDGV